MGRRGVGLHEHDKGRVVAKYLNMIAVLLKLQWAEGDLYAWLSFNTISDKPHGPCHWPCMEILEFMRTLSGQLIPGRNRKGSGKSMLKDLLAVCL